MKAKIYLFAVLLITAQLLSAQEKISLIEVEKVKEYLSLNDVQYNSIKTILKEIESVLEEDKKVISGLKERVKNDDEPGFFEKIKVKKGRDGRISEIKGLIKKVENQLNSNQKEKFKNVIKPELQGLRKEEIFGSGN